MSAIQHLITEHLDIWTTADTGPKSGRGRSAANAAKVYGISKLRELILELAVRGRLVPQDASDEPASELLKRIQAEKAKLIAKGKVKKEKPLPPITENEMPLDLPQSWELVRLGDIAFSQAGFAFKSNGFNESGLGLPLIRIRDVGQLFTGTYFDGEYRDEFVVRNGDYLISMDGEFRVAKWLNKDALLNQRVSRLIFFGTELAGGFVAESLQARLRGLQGVKAYTTVDHLSGGQISSSIIGLPPIQEQHRIVAKVDELMALCDQLEAEHNNATEAHEKLVSHLLGTLTQSQSAEDFSANWQRIAAHFDTLFTTEASIDALKQTLLQLAVMGKLVPQDPNDEPASKLLQRIDQELCKTIDKPLLPKMARDKSTTEPSEFHWIVPRNWTWCELQDIALFENGKAHEQFVADDGRFVLINSSFISNNGDKVKHVSERLTPLSKDNIAIVMSDVPNGRALARCFLVMDDDKYALNQRIGSLKSGIEVSKRYLLMVLDRNKYYLSYDDGKKQTNLKKIQVLSCPIPLPPCAEQHRVVAKVDELMALCDQLKSRLTKASKLQQKLADVLVENAAIETAKA